MNIIIKKLCPPWYSLVIGLALYFAVLIVGIVIIEENQMEGVCASIVFFWFFASPFVVHAIGRIISRLSKSTCTPQLITILLEAHMDSRLRLDNNIIVCSKYDKPDVTIRKSGPGVYINNVYFWNDDIWWEACKLINKSEDSVASKKKQKLADDLGLTNARPTNVDVDNLITEMQLKGLL